MAKLSLRRSGGCGQMELPSPTLPSCSPSWRYCRHGHATFLATPRFARSFCNDFSLSCGVLVKDITLVLELRQQFCSKLLERVSILYTAAFKLLCSCRTEIMYIKGPAQCLPHSVQQILLLSSLSSSLSSPLSAAVDFMAD